MMARVAVGHTGRAMQASGLTIVAFVLINCAAALRGLAPLVYPAGYHAWLMSAGICWILAFGLFLGVHAPMLVAPRPDGRPGRRGLGGIAWERLKNDRTWWVERQRNLSSLRQGHRTQTRQRGGLEDGFRRRSTHPTRSSCVHLASESSRITRASCRTGPCLTDHGSFSSTEAPDGA
ncbi:MAG: NnrS family protein [Thiocapsa sp. C3-sup]